MFTKAMRLAITAAAIGVAAVPAVGQGFSEGYQFLQAVKDRDATKVDSFLSSPGTIVNTKERGTGDTALHIVTRDRNATWLRYIVGKGGRVDAPNNQGETPLTLATQMGWVEGVQTLLSLRANVNGANTRGETPLILAVQRRDLPLVKMLLSRGADPRKTDRVAGQSALDYARRDARAAVILKALEDQPATAKKDVAGPSL